MTVEELIKELKKHNQSQEIWCVDFVNGDFATPEIFSSKDCLNDDVLVVGVKNNWLDNN